MGQDWAWGFTSALIAMPRTIEPLGEGEDDLERVDSPDSDGQQ